jgi:class 3 adenylate cyclase/tetratricopeptide (TPR) repeat protein
MHEVRKTVTILFADVVSSTQLGERLETEALRGVVSRYFAEMAQVVEAHGGTVEKFIGDEVMAVFGVPATHEDDGLRAVRAAVAMHERLRELNRELDERWGAQLEIRVGINTGEVVAGDHSAGHGFVTGEAVNLAKRVEQAAKPGEILIGESTARLVAHAVLTTPLEPLVVKGKQDAVLAHRVLSVDPSPEAVPRRFDVPLVGRSSELGALRFAYARAVETRRPQLVTVLGAAGIGKSRLARELLDEVRDDAHVLVGRCLPYGEGITFWPVRDILPGEPLDGTTEEIFARVRTRLQELAAERPLVVCFEDVHWGEPTFLDLVQYLAGWIRDAGVVLLCLARPDLLERRPDWATTGADTLSIRLTRLTDDDTADLLEQLDADAGLRALVTEAAEGNPLFVEQMVAMAADSAGEVTTPPSIRALLTARLDRLEPTETAVIQRAAVIGREFPLRAVVELAPPELRPHVSGHLLGLVRKEFVRPHTGEDDRFRFRHALIRDAAYEAMPKQLRAELHDQHAQWLGSIDRSGPLVAYHLEQAALLLRELGAVDKALEPAQRAAAMLREYGLRAYGRGDAPAAAALLDRTVALLADGDADRASVLVELADACMRLGQFERAREVLEEALSSANATGDRRTELRAIIGRRILRVFMPTEDLDDGLADDVLIAELEALADDLGLARAWRILSEPHAAACRWGARAEALERALAHAQRLPQSRHEASAIAVLLVQALHFGPTPASETASRCRELLRESDRDLPLQAGIKATLGAVLAAQGRFDDARRTYADSARLHEELGLRLRRAVGTILGAEIEMLANDPAGAERELTFGYQTLEAMGDTGVRAVVAGYLAEALYAQSRYDESASYVDIAAEIADPDDVAAQALHRVTRARLLTWSGDTAAAERLGREAVRLAEPTDFIALQASAALALADAVAADGREAEARALTEQAGALYASKENVAAVRRLSAGLSQLAPKA